MIWSEQIHRSTPPGGRDRFDLKFFYFLKNQFLGLSFRLFYSIRLENRFNWLSARLGVGLPWLDDGHSSNRISLAHAEIIYLSANEPGPGRRVRSKLWM